MKGIRTAVVLALLLIAASLGYGQAGATGTILGTVTDSTGAIIPNAKITVTNTATNVSYRTVSSSAGDYQVPALNPGTYKVSAEAPGFQKSTTTAFTLTVDQKVRVNLPMKPGEVTTTLEVTAQAVALDTDTAALSQLVSQQQVENLPLNGRNFMQLLLVTPGAVTVGGEQGTMRQGEGDAVSVNGGRPEGNNYTLDGLVNTDPALVTPAVILSQDAIGEFKVESGTYPAEYGFSASQINIVSKSGTNKFHGSLFEDNRNDAYDALPFPTIEQYLPGGTKTTNPLLRQNQFGFVASGPVWIPKVYDGRDKSFFMANYEGWRINNGGIAYETVPNPAVLTGDFSAETYAPGIGGLPGGPLPAYGTPDCAVLLNNGYNCMPVDPTTGQPFSGNQVPSSAFTARIGQVAIKNNYWAAPTVPNQPEGITNFVKGYPGQLRTNQQTYRGDQNLGKLGSVFGRFTKSDYVNHSLYNSGSLDYGIEMYLENQKAWAVSHTINLGKATVNNFRFGYLDAYAPESSVTPPSTLASDLGETGVFTTFGPLQETWPNVGLSGYSSGGGPVNSYSGSDSPAWEWADSFTQVRGRHTFGFGVDYRTYSLTRNLDDDFYGDWGFSGNNILTNSSSGSCPNAPVTVTGSTTPQSLCGTGNSVADLMLGYFSSVGGFVPGPLSPTDQAGNPQTHVFKYFAPYAEDDWKITPKLTMSLGLRWDFRAATTEAHNHFFWLDTKNANGGLCYADPELSKNGVAPGGDANSGPILRYCGSVPHPGSKTPFAPRLGLNYRLTDKTVVRGGYGIFYDSYEGREIDDSADIYPYSIRNSLNPSNIPTLSKFSNDMFPAYSTLGPFPASTLSFIAVIESENPLNPYVQSWTGSVERELWRNTTLEANYIGTHSVHLLDRHDIAQPYALDAADQPFCQETDSSGNYINLTVAPCNPYVAVSGAYPRLPYRNFQGFYIDSDFHGYAHYNAMNVKLEHRARDLAATVIYTWASSKDDKSAAAGVGASGTGYQGFMDNHNTKLDYGPSDFDVDQRFVSSFIYNLPVGRGKRFASGVNRAADLIVGGWQITGITTFQAGFPFGVTSSDIGGVQGTVAPRPNIVAGCDPHGHLTGMFQRLNMACFTQQLPGTFGNTKRNFLRQPGINNWDMGFSKSFNFAESVSFKLSVDTFNTFNHHQYSGDVGGLVVGGSGGNETIDNSVNSSSATAGRITGASSPRILQLGGKLTF
jgi:Carboxypeptidase regulatory-like domain/TonB dependent receptor-like, beta-barrel